MLHMLQQLQMGLPVFGMAAAPVLSQPGQLGYICADRTSEDLLETARSVGVDTKILKLRSLVDDASIDIGKFETAPTQVLFDLLASLEGCALIVVDPLIVFTGVDTNKYHLNAAKLIRINRFCMDHKITVLGTHHATKARTDYGFKRAQDRISGSSALLGYTSTQLFLAAPEETEGGQYYEWTIVSHHAAPRTLYLTRHAHGFELIKEATIAPPPPVEHRIMSLLSIGPCKTGDLCTACKASRATVYRALEQMELTGVVIKERHGVYRLAESADHPES